MHSKHAKAGCERLREADFERHRIDRPQANRLTERLHRRERCGRRFSGKRQTVGGLQAGAQLHTVSKVVRRAVH